MLFNKYNKKKYKKNLIYTINLLSKKKSLFFHNKQICSITELIIILIILIIINNNTDKKIIKFYKQSTINSYDKKIATKILKQKYQYKNLPNYFNILNTKKSIFNNIISIIYINYKNKTKNYLHLLYNIINTIKYCKIKISLNINQKFFFYIKQIINKKYE